MSSLPTPATYRTALANLDFSEVQRYLDHFPLEAFAIVEATHSPSSPTGARHQALQVRFQKSPNRHALMYLLGALQPPAISNHAEIAGLSAIGYVDGAHEPFVALAKIVTTLCDEGLGLTYPTGEQSTVECIDTLSGNNLLHLCVIKRQTRLLCWLLLHTLSTAATRADEVPLSRGLILSESASGTIKRYLSLPNANGLTPLQLAASTGDLDGLQALIEMPDNGHIRDVIVRSHLMHLAAAGGHTLVARYSLNRCLEDAEITPETATTFIGMRGLGVLGDGDEHYRYSASIEGGGSPFHLACSNARTELVSYFLDAVVSRCTHNMDATAAEILATYAASEARQRSASATVPAAELPSAVVSAAIESSLVPPPILAPLLGVRATVKSMVAEARDAVESLILERDSGGRCSIHCAAEGRAKDGAGIPIMELLINEVPSCIHAEDDGGRSAGELAVHKGYRENALAILRISKEAATHSRKLEESVSDKFHQLSTIHLRPEESHRPAPSPMINAHNKEQFSTSVLVTNTVNGHYVASLTSSMASPSDTLKDLDFSSRSVFHLPRR